MTTNTQQAKEALFIHVIENKALAISKNLSSSIARI
jgi:hypothetical protein